MAVHSDRLQKRFFEAVSRVAELSMVVLKWAQRYRRHIYISLYSCLIVCLIYVIYDPLPLARSFPDLLPSGFGSARVNAHHTTQPPEVRFPTPAMMKVLHLPFVPRDFRCENMFEESRHNFSYSETYWEHVDAFKSVLGYNNLMALSVANEHSWILQELARLPFVTTVCENNFNAGQNTFNWLAAQEDVVVYSFDSMEKNYSLEMTDFMAIEFPDRFFVYTGDQQQKVLEFVDKYQNQTFCDITFIDSSVKPEVIRSNLLHFSRIANPVENVVLMDTHPKHAGEGGRAADALMVWNDFVKSGVITELFQCYFEDIVDIGATERGLTVGSFAKSPK